MLIDYGSFSAYTPSTDDEQALSRAGVLFIKNGDGVDWYDLTNTPWRGTKWAVVSGSKVVGITDDPTGIFPVGSSVIETDQTVSVGMTWDGSTLADPLQSLDAVKSRLLTKIDADAETARQKVLSATPGQILTYQEKHAQARAVIGMGEAAANAMSATDAEHQFPTLSASVGIEASTLWACAQLVIQRYEAFADASLKIERTRLASKKSVREATTIGDANSVYSSISFG